MRTLRHLSIRTACVCAAALMALRAGAETANFVGNDGDAWDSLVSWSTARIPTAADDVVIDGKWVQSAGSITAKSILVKGTAGYLTVGGTSKSAIAAQTGADPTSTDPSVLTVAGDLVLNGGRFSIGGRFQRRGMAVSVGGDLVITNGANAYFYAGRTDGLDPLQQDASARLLFENANVVKVGGELRVGKSSMLVPENERLSGTPVFFKTKDFTLESGGTITSTGRGWRKFKTTSFAAGDFPVGAVSGTSYVGSTVDLSWYTYSFQSGTAYWLGCGHGGNSNNRGTPSVRQITDSDGTYKTVSRKAGYAYGYETAPFLSGAAAGVWNESQVYAGGGSICIFASGTATVDGTLSSDGETGGSNYNSSAGGSIWIAASSITVGRSAVFTTTGEKSNYGTNGAGGRIALTAGATAAELSSFDTVTNMTAYGFVCTDLYGCTATALGGYVQSTRVGTGTVKLVYRPTSSLPVEITATPEEQGTVSPFYGFHVLDKTNLPNFTAGTDAVYDTAYRSLRRLSLGSYVVTDLEGNVVTTPFASATDCLRLTWGSVVENFVRIRACGGGSVKVNGTAYDGAADVWLVEDSTMTIEAVDGTGEFRKWVGDLTGAANTNRTLNLAVVAGLTVQAVFSDAPSLEKSYVGADAGFWEDDANWSPSGMPSPVDSVTISSKKVRTRNAVAAGSLVLSGAKLAIGGTTGDTTAMSPPSDVVVQDAGLLVTGSVSVAGASELSVGARRLTAPILALSIGGDLSLAGTSKMTLYAPPYDGPLDGGKIPLTNAYDTAQVMSVGGNLTLSDSAVLYPENDIVTGRAIRFDVAGDVTVGASATISSTLRGWGWTNWKTDVLGEDSRRRAAEGDYQTLAYGHGYDYGYGGVYGGGFTTAINNTNNSRLKYGFLYAPCLCGSPGGAYNSTGTRGGGTVWIHALGTMTVNGTVVSNGGKTAAGTATASSGGGIWLAAKKFVWGESALLKAIGGDCSGNGSYGGGSGGRISLATNVAEADLRSLSMGETPENLTYADEITACSTSVAGGYSYTSSSTGLKTYAEEGTCSSVLGEVDEFFFTVASSPANLVAEGVTYETVTVQKGATVTRTAPARAYLSSDPSNVRYSFKGWVVSNATEEVAHGEGQTASFVASQGPFTLTWLWQNRESRTSYAPNNSEWGEVRVNGSEESSSECWAAGSVDLTLVPIAKEGCEFLFWAGEVPLSYAKTNSFRIVAEKPLQVTPVFRRAEAPRTRTWAGGTSATGDWTDCTKWDPSDNLPGFADTVVISNGYCIVSNYLECANLVVSNAAIVRVAQFPLLATDKAVSVTSDRVSTYARSYALGSADVIVSGDLTLCGSAQLGMGARRGKFPCNIKVGGNLTLSGSSKLHLVGGMTNATTVTHATGTARVDVGGTLAVRDTAAVYPESEYWTGGTPVFRVGQLVVEEGAKFDADAHGYDRGLSEDGLSPLVIAPGAGYSHSPGAGYGGCGGNANVTYGFENSPIEPGSCKGNYNNGEIGQDAFRGGGLIRIHVADKATIDGTLSARGTRSDIGSTYGGGASGGGIWVTAKRFSFGENASMTVCGRDIGGNYGSQGGGGRIALGWGLSESQIEAMTHSAALPRRVRAKNVYDYDGFAAFWPQDGRGAVPSVDLKPGKNAGTLPTDQKYYGTFRFVDGRPRGLMVIVK